MSEIYSITVDGKNLGSIPLSRLGGRKRLICLEQLKGIRVDFVGEMSLIEFDKQNKNNLNVEDFEERNE